jgi:hypothetical protein
MGAARAEFKARPVFSAATTRCIRFKVPLRAVRPPTVDLGAQLLGYIQAAR